MKSILIIGSLFLATTATAGEIVFNFNSPAFSGNGWSTHVLTIEQLEQQRKDKIVAEEQAALDKAERDYRNTNSYKFQNNLESRIYAQISRQIADNLFGEDPVLDNTDDWVSTETPFGDTVRWKRFEGRIYVEVYDSNNDIVAEFNVPVGEFAF